MRVLNRAFDHPMEPEEHAALPFAGGIMQHGYQCGMLWGAALAAGARAHRLFGPGPQAETRAVIAAGRLMEPFRARNGHINCLEITEMNKSSSALQMIMYFLIKGGAVGCFRMAARYAPAAFDEINSAFIEDLAQEPSGPVSCAALLARKMGASDGHATMAAGFAGGIGLSGGACGALGAAVWIIAMNIGKERAVDNLWKDQAFNSRFGGLIDRFLKSSDHTFECAEIVGRSFDDVGDHAAHLRNGGCSEIIEALAAK